MKGQQTQREIRITQFLRLMKNSVMEIQQADDSFTVIDLLELAALDSIGADDLAKIDGITDGTGAAGKAVVLDSNGAARIPGIFDLDGNIMAVEAGAGITDGASTIYRSSAVKQGGIIKTSILMDLTSLSSATSDLDVIGIGSNAAHLGRITAAVSGTILHGYMTCLELPSSLTDIDLYSATEATGVFEDNESTLTATALLTKGGAWSAGDITPFTALPAANQYLYLVNGAADTADVFTAGKFLIELWGYDA